MQDNKRKRPTNNITDKTTKENKQTNKQSIKGGKKRKKKKKRKNNRPRPKEIKIANWNVRGLKLPGPEPILEIGQL